MNETTIAIGEQKLRVVRGTGENEKAWFADYDSLRELLNLHHEPMPKNLRDVLMISLGRDGWVGKEIRAVSEVLHAGVGSDRSRELAVANAIDGWSAPKSP